VEAPYRGFTASPVRPQIPYVPVPIDPIEHDGGNLKLLILLNLDAISDAQCAAVRNL
jgi:hypothetical protein